MTKPSDGSNAVWPAAMAPVAEHLRANTELITHMNQIVSRAAQSMAARQSAVIAEAVSDMTTLLRTAVSDPRDPSVTTRAYAAYVEAVVQRGMAQLNFSVETIAEMSSSALELARRRFALVEQSEPETAPARQPPPRK